MKDRKPFTSHLRNALALAVLIGGGTFVHHVIDTGEAPSKAEEPTPAVESTPSDNASQAASEPGIIHLQGPLTLNHGSHTHVKYEPAGYVEGTDIEIWDPAYPDDPEYQLVLKKFWETYGREKLPEGHYSCPPRPETYYSGYEKRREQLLKEHAVK
ncbi:hypothetical protein [Pelagicoccus sp. SDUM812003]|uniref:hypothetical protein n=1 Tax=Pelagicoccus sp. SDUM812003 TaxID=3041267 RepID=UPI00280D8EF4|nr:hypothetical protein [Pelagicoccus sp. SDUM812003]MDQ8205799.1 hypothetical protein [Pelagicoccus sp. SDUM812003]